MGAIMNTYRKKEGWEDVAMYVSAGLKGRSFSRASQKLEGTYNDAIEGGKGIQIKAIS